MHSKLHHSRPQHDSRDDEEKPGPDSYRVEQEKSGKTDGDPEQGGRIDPRGIENRDDDDRSNVVHDGERQQENAQCRRDAASHQREDPDGERDIGCHGHTPTHPAGARHVQREKQQCGYDHATERRRQGKSGALQLG